MIKKQNGFTMIEIMITVAILGIVVALALPSYQNYVFKARRVDATNALLRINAEQEKFYFDNNTYMNPATFAAQNTANGWFPNQQSENGHYALTITPNGASYQDGFTATATPVAGGVQANDSKCTTLSIDSSGQRTATGTDREYCWR